MGRERERERERERGRDRGRGRKRERERNLMESVFQGSCSESDSNSNYIIARLPFDPRNMQPPQFSLPRDVRVPRNCRNGTCQAGKSPLLQVFRPKIDPIFW